MELINFWKFWLEGVLLPIVGAFGVTGKTRQSSSHLYVSDETEQLTTLTCVRAGNLITATILLRSQLGLTLAFTQLLTALLLSDSVCILMTFALFSLPKFLTMSPYIIPVSLPFAQVFLTFSILMTLTLSVERYLVVSSPNHKVTQSSSLERGAKYHVNVVEMLLRRHSKLFPDRHLMLDVRHLLCIL